MEMRRTILTGVATVAIGGLALTQGGASGAGAGAGGAGGGSSSSSAGGSGSIMNNDRMTDGNSAGRSRPTYPSGSSTGNSGEAQPAGSLLPGSDPSVTGSTGSQSIDETPTRGSSTDAPSR